MQPTRLVVIALISGALAMPLGGFVFGFMQCDDCGANLLGRGFIGLVFAVLTPLSGGYPPRNEGGVGAPFNACPHIVAAWILLSAYLIYRDQRRRPNPIKSEVEAD
jgi:hypothetical protein